MHLKVTYSAIQTNTEIKKKKKNKWLTWRDQA